MARIELKYLELHIPLFTGGQTLGAKLHPKSHAGIILEWDTEMRAALVQLPDKELVSVIPEATVASWQPVDPADISVKMTQKPKQPTPAPTNHAVRQNDLLIQQSRAQAAGFKSAQVSTPAGPVDPNLTSLKGAPKYKPHAPKPQKPAPLDPATVKKLPDDTETH